VVALRHFVVLLAVVAGAVAACTRVEPASSSPDVPLGEGGAAGEATGGAGSLAGNAGAGSGGEYVGEGGALGTIELGVWPTFAAEPNGSRDVQAVLASVSALSLGSTTLPLVERWDQLSGATGSPRTLTWNRLDAMTQPFHDRGGSVALCIGVVDREQPAWPFAGDLGSAAAASAIERTIDEVYARYGSSLSHLCFGYELDRFLAVASEDDQASLLAFLEHAVDYASHHPLHRAKTAIGTAVTLDGLSRDAALADFMLGDEVVAVYDALDSDAALKPPGAVVDELASALGVLDAAPGPKRALTLFEVGYPSGADVGSSQKAQRSYYEGLFGLLDTRRDAFGFVGINGLADRAAADCEAEALVFGGSTDGDVAAAWASARCSMGLRADTSDKLAWPEVAAALSRFR